MEILIVIILLHMHRIRKGAVFMYGKKHSWPLLNCKISNQTAPRRNILQTIDNSSRWMFFVARRVQEINVFSGSKLRVIVNISGDYLTSGTTNHLTISMGLVDCSSCLKPVRD